MLFSDILRNEYWDQFETFGENFDFDTFKNDTFESVWVDRHPQYISWETFKRQFSILKSMLFIYRDPTRMVGT